jgi:hypothetical protein
MAGTALGSDFFEVCAKNKDLWRALETGDVVAEATTPRGNHVHHPARRGHFSDHVLKTRTITPFGVSQ